MRQRLKIVKGQFCPLLQQNQMRKRLAVNCYSQFPAMGKVRLAQTARAMFLCKEHFLWRPFGRCPNFVWKLSELPALACVWLRPARRARVAVSRAVALTRGGALLSTAAAATAQQADFLFPQNSRF
jgi:hypothetical protein